MQETLMKNFAMETEIQIRAKNTWIFILSLSLYPCRTLMTDRFVNRKNTQDFYPDHKPMSIVDWMQRFTEILNLGYRYKTWIYVQAANLTSIQNVAWFSIFRSNSLRFAHELVWSH